MTLTLLFLLTAGIAGVLYPFFFTGKAQTFAKNEAKQAQKAIKQFTDGLQFTGAPDSIIRGNPPSHVSDTIASTPASSGDYTVTAPNELSPQRIDAILRYFGSPVVGEGQAIYDLGNQYGIDDIFFLADYRKESSLGNSTLASAPYYNPTGMECSDLADGCTGADGNGRNWGTWNSREAGYAAWFKQISQRYVSGAIDGGYRLTTIWLIACGPNGTGMYDGGSGCNQYAANIERWIDTWRSGGY